VEQVETGSLKSSSIMVICLLLFLFGAVTLIIGVGSQISAASRWQEAEAAKAELSDPNRLKKLEEQAALRKERDFLEDKRLRLETRKRAFAEKKRHLRLDTAASTLFLAEDGFVLRAMPVEIGPPVPARWSPLGDFLPVSSWPVPGAYRLDGRVGRGVFLQQDTVDLLEAHWLDGEPIPEHLNAAITLEDGTRLYAEFAVPVLPPPRDGAIRMTIKDLNAILSQLEDTLVYVW
jgi:hypothetical protein